MKKNTYRWACGYEKVYGNFHADNERCLCRSKKGFDTILEAAREAMKHNHSCSTYVYSDKGYIGLASGLYFNNVTA